MVESCRKDVFFMLKRRLKCRNYLFKKRNAKHESYKKSKKKRICLKYGEFRFNSYELSYTCSYVCTFHLFVHQTFMIPSENISVHAMHVYFILLYACFLPPSFICKLILVLKYTLVPCLFRWKKRERERERDRVRETEREREGRERERARKRKPVILFNPMFALSTTCMLWNNYCSVITFLVFMKNSYRTEYMPEFWITVQNYFNY